MLKFIKSVRVLTGAAIIAAAAACVSPASAGTLAQLVNNASGPTTAVYAYSVTIGSNSYFSGVGSNIPTLPVSNFAIDGVPFFGSDTIIFDQFDNMDVGTFSLNIDAAHPQNDFLVEQIDFGSGVGAPTGLQTVFDSTHFLGFGAVPGGFPGEYWFAFQQNATGSSLSPAGGIIGGIMQTDADIKVFGVSAPTPSAALGGMVLIVGLAGWSMAKRFTSKTA